MAQAHDLNQAAALAERLAERLLTAVEKGELTTEQLRNSREVALILEVAKMLQSAGAQFPPGMRRLAEKGAGQKQT